MPYKSRWKAHNVVIFDINSNDIKIVFLPSVSCVCSFDYRTRKRQCLWWKQGKSQYLLLLENVLGQSFQNSIHNLEFKRLQSYVGCMTKLFLAWNTRSFEQISHVTPQTLNTLKIYLNGRWVNWSLHAVCTFTTILTVLYVNDYFLTFKCTYILIERSLIGNPGN